MRDHSHRLRDSSESVLIGNDLVKAIGGALPVGMPGPLDYDDGNSSTMSTIIGTMGLAGTVIENLTDGKGNVTGDIILTVRSTDGKATSWDITETITFINGPGCTSKKDYQYSRQQALDFITANKEYLKQAGLYEDIASALGL
jgi:hypothetical protein